MTGTNGSPSFSSHTERYLRLPLGFHPSNSCMVLASPRTTGRLKKGLYEFYSRNGGEKQCEVHPGEEGKARDIQRASKGKSSRGISGTETMI